MNVVELLNDPHARYLAGMQDVFVDASTRFWRARGACTVLLPMTTVSVSSPSGRGSDSTPVAVSIGGTDVYLADSMQFYLELALRITGQPVFYIMPSFRGDAPDETHLPQFFHSEVELDGDLDTIIEAAEAYLRFVVAALHDGCGQALDEVGAGRAHVSELLARPCFKRLTFEEAAAVVPSHIVTHEGWRTISRSGEQELVAQVGGPVWLTHFDHLAVPFYQGFADTQHSLAANADLLLGSGELLGAGARHATFEALTEAIALHEVDPLPYKWYLEMKQASPRSTAGFGLGFERLLMWLFNAPDIRSMQLIGRDSPGSLLL